MGYIYIGDEHKDMISKCFKYGLTNGNFYLSNSDNQQLRITNVAKKYRWEKNFILIMKLLLSWKKNINQRDEIDCWENIQNASVQLEKLKDNIIDLVDI